MPTTFTDGVRRRSPNDPLQQTTYTNPVPTSSPRLPAGTPRTTQPPTTAAPTTQPANTGIPAMPNAPGGNTGFDPNKWTDPNHQTDKYVGGRLAATPGSTNASVVAGLPPGYSVVPGSTDKIVGPRGAVIDIYQDEEGKHIPQWTRQGGTGSAQQIASGRKKDMELNPHKYLPGGVNYAAHGQDYATMFPDKYKRYTQGAYSNKTGEWLPPVVQGFGSGQPPTPVPNRIPVDPSTYPTQNSFSSYRNDPSAPYPKAGAEFDDPWGRNLEGMVGNRLTELGQNANSPNLQQFMDQLFSRAQSTDQRAGEFATTLRDRAAELNKDPYTDQQADVMRTKAMDTLNRRRQDSLKNRREEIYARGFEPTSGLVAASDRDVHNTYDQATTQIDSDLLLNSIDEGYRRKNEAVNLEGLAQAALAGADTTSLGMYGQRADAENARYNQTEDRRREALTTAGLPLNLMDRRAAMATQALNAGQGGQDPFASIMQLLNYGQQQEGLEQAGRNNNMQGLGTLAQILMEYFGGRS